MQDERKSSSGVVVSKAALGKASEGEYVSHQSVFYGISGRSTTRGDSQLAVDRAHMKIDGDHADDKLLGNLSTGQALGEQAQHVHLTWGEPNIKCGRKHGFRR